MEKVEALGESLMWAKIKKNYSGKRYKVQGVAYIESLLALLLFFALVGGILTMGIAVYRYVLLVHVVTQGVRAVAVNPPSELPKENNCLQSKFDTRVSETMDLRFQNLGISTAGRGITYTSSIIKTTVNGKAVCVLNVVATWPNAIPCPFCVGLKPGVRALTATASIPMEEPDWVHCNGCRYCT